MQKKWIVYAEEEAICGIVLKKRIILIGGFIQNKKAIEHIMIKYFGVELEDAQISNGRVRYRFHFKGLKINRVIEELSQSFTVIETRSFGRLMR